MAGAVFIAGCRGERPAEARTDLASLVDSLKPSVERAAGLKFREPLKVATRTREQLRVFLIAKADEQLTPERVRGTELAYKLLGLLPDSLDLHDLLIKVLEEQVAGFYDPETSTLYAVEGYERSALVFLLSHEMIHALQDQYLPLDSIMRPQPDDDRQVAAQAILEGQAFLASLKVLLPSGQSLSPEIWEQSRMGMAAAGTLMPEFTNAPLVIREQLLFPYLSGGEFMMWWSGSEYADTMPYGPRMPVSSEQILQPARYQQGDQPIAVRFSKEDDALFENTLGDLNLRILGAVLSGGDKIADRLAVGWGGDRFRVYETPAGAALVWVILWDNEDAAERFRRGTGARLAERSRPRYRVDLVSNPTNGVPATRIVIAPVSWMGWMFLPEARMDP